ncbi:MAG: hypothetical protein L3K26_09920 [Candidatus Hydrogenedentes bacterium]|nr:hypothetical protein [Candidatus Hydrogenedentota bacterium]
MRKKYWGLFTAKFRFFEYAVYFLILVYFLVPEAPQKLEALINPTPAPRVIYFKLPLEQTEYHWVFEERAAYLAGTLTLRIHGVDGEELITVFDKGIISEDWDELGCADEESNDKIYFGFQSNQTFMVTNGDHVEMVLELPIDVEGTGPHAKGILGAGEYRATNAIKVYSTDSDVAFLFEKKWSPQWNLDITQETG